MVKSAIFEAEPRHHPLGPPGNQVTLHALRLQRQEDNQVLIQVRDWKSPKIRCRKGGLTKVNSLNLRISWTGLVICTGIVLLLGIFWGVLKKEALGDEWPAFSNLKLR